MSEQIGNDLVRFSRAGDTFHYRWAALRCLKMIHPLSKVNMITIENSKEPKAAGEYIIDVAEYVTTEKNEEIHYYQLKHTTVRKEDPFTLAKLEDSIKGFAERYLEHKKRKNSNNVYFYVITNRLISQRMKNNLLKIKDNKQCSKQFMEKMKAYTKLDGTLLSDFCGRVRLLDGYGDYKEQWNTLYFEMGKLIAGQLEHPQVDTLIAMIADKALPDSDGRVCAEDVLKRLGYASIQELYPAPPEFEELSNIVMREQYIDLMRKIERTDENIIIHAPGGVGKSIFAKALEQAIGDKGTAILYDCFGLGKYRNRSKIRHSYRVALTQIVNELSTKGLCDPMLVSASAKENEILNTFFERISVTVKNIRKNNEEGELYIVIDAADNAEMAAKEFGDSCFVHELIREKMPQYCHLIMLCRTERIHLLKPLLSTKKFQLLPFSEDETKVYLKERIKGVSDKECLEIHRLTDGNPRVQSNAITFANGKKKAVLEYLGPKGTTVEGLIEYQLEKAVETIKEGLTEDFKEQIETICCGLATLPPFIPIDILANASKVEEVVIKSFISDLGRALWVLDDVVQFRDEPTESWFRKTYAGNKEQIILFIDTIQKLANKSVYVAEVLPVLYLQAEMYQELVELALSDKCLPTDNPIEIRNVRLFRLQFAFKAALKSKQYTDATKLALLAGEESAGNKRQTELFKQNIDLIPILQTKEKVQDLAFKRTLGGNWVGSENIYTASLLASIAECKGEALSYFRAANEWLHIYLNEYYSKKDNHDAFCLEDEEIAELAYTCYCLYGLKEAGRFMLGWKPPSIVFKLFRLFTKRLIDFGNLDEINELSEQVCFNLYGILGINYELERVGLFVNKNVLEKCLKKMPITKISSLHNHSTYKDDRTMAIIAYVEACMYHALKSDKVKKIVQKYLPQQASHSFVDNFSGTDDREEFLRSRVIMYCMNFLIEDDSWIPKGNRHDEEAEFKKVYSILFPWYELRLNCILRLEDNILDKINQIENETSKSLQVRYQKYDRLPYDIAQVRADILIFSNNSAKNEVEEIYQNVVRNIEHFRISSQIEFLRATKRLIHLKTVNDNLEYLTFERIKKLAAEAENMSDEYVSLARTVLNVSLNDATEYFDMAVNAVSQFGDELPNRWRAIADVAEKCSEGFCRESDLAYRFIRCAEMVGDNVAREKYWDRNKAVRVCTQLSPAEGLAAISRWRERGIGWMNELFPVVATAIVRDGYMAPKAAWSLSAFILDRKVLDYSEVCAEMEIVQEISKIIKLKGQYYFDLLEIDYNIKNKYSSNSQITNRYVMTEEEVCSLFGDLDLMNENGISTLIERFRKSGNAYGNEEIFWNTLYRNVPDGRYADFLMLLIKLPEFKYWNMSEAIKYIPEMWFQKPSFNKKWKSILQLIGIKYAHPLLNKYAREELLNNIVIKEPSKKIIYEGILMGISQSASLENIDDYFEYVSTSTCFLNSEEAKDILNFALARLELHIPEEFGDGIREQKASKYPESKVQLARFLWTALGSPEAAVRWQAVHAIVRLAEFDCKEEIAMLIEVTTQEKLEWFSHREYTHYILHSHLYLLIALQRVVKDNAEILLPYKEKFLHYAVKFMPHALIQKYAVDIIISIEQTFPKSYSTETYEEAINSVKSPFRIIDKKDYIEEQSEEIDTEKIKFYHGYDFERYWFEPLGRVFGVSEKYVQKRASEIITKVWNINSDGGYKTDPRYGLWEKNGYYEKTSHSHGSYPSIEKYNFYLSFHAMLVVAAELLKERPIIHFYDWEEKPWDKWLMRHRISRKDGYFLFDSREVIPKDILKWYEKEKDSNWKESLMELDFIQAIKCEEKSICLDGYWEIKDDGYKEEVFISSALVSKEGASSLITALMNYDDPHDYKLPGYSEKEWEYNDNPFELKGLVDDIDTERGIDGFDPWAGEICDWNCKIGEDYQKLLSQNEIKRYVWSVPYEGRRETEYLLGKRLNISKEALKQIVKMTGLFIIFEVQIDRSIERNYGSHDDYVYTPSKHRIYVFDEEGELRNE
ncbi:hypothetical protein UT300005_03610 [Clostridium sp. CTA-5]